MQRSWKDFVVGLTVIVGLLGVALLLLLFGELQGVRGRSYDLKVQIADASGLSASSSVTLNGVPIGTLKSIEIADAANPGAGVVVWLRIREGVRVPRDVRITLERGLVGDAAMAMSTVPRPPGAQAAVDLGFAQPGETMVTSASGFLDGIASMIDARLSAFTSAAAAVEELSKTYTDVGKRAGALLEQRAPDDVDRGDAPANLPSTLARLDRAVRAAETWLGDDAIRGDARAAAGRLSGLMDDAANAVDEWTQTGRALRSETTRLGDQGEKALQEFALTTATLNETIMEVQRLVAKVNRGEGTAGKLVTNPDLYNAVTDAATRLERALTEAQLLFEKYRKEGVPIRF